MKNTKNTLFILSVFSLLTLSIHAQSPKHEFRASWLSTAASDWPSSRTAATQKTELTNLFDLFAENNLNAVPLQVRSQCDVIYKSSYEPWANFLTGTRGKDPGYDPLEFAVTEAHKRGLELHAWVNPFRYESSSPGKWGTNDPIRKNHSDWLLEYDDMTLLDPGIPAVRDYIVEVVREIVRNYDIDGIVFDDYFYRYDGTTNEDQQTQWDWKPVDQDLGDWRRENADKLIKAIYDMIQKEKPWVRFGVAPFGTYTVDASVVKKYNVTLPSGISSMDAYHKIYCNTLEWMNGGYVDYVSPQLYWPTTQKGVEYDKLSKWWSDIAKTFSDRQSGGKKIHFFASHGNYKLNESGDKKIDLPEILKQIGYNRQYDKLNAPGSIFFRTKAYYDSQASSIKQDKFQNKALPPAMDWKETATLDAPTSVTLTGTKLSWSHAKAERFTVYAYPKGTDATEALENSAYLLGIVYGKSLSVAGVSNLANTTFAVRAYDRYGNEYAAGFYNAASKPDTGDDKPAEGTTDFKALWTKTVSDLGLSTASDNRSMAYYDGDLYVPRKDKGTFVIINAANGAKTDEKTIAAAAFWQHNLRITDDGQMLLGNTGAGSTTISIYPSDCANGGVAAATTASITGRSDYFYTYGEWNKSGYLVSLSNTGNSLTYVPFANGALQDEKQVTNTSLPVGTSAKAVPADTTSIYANARDIIPTKHNLTTGALLDSFSGEEQPATVSVSGLAVFALHGHQYMVTPADIAGGFDLFEITDGLAKAKRVITTTPALGTADNATYTVDFCVSTAGNDAFIYVLAPNNGIAAYQFTFTPKSTTTCDALETLTSRVLPTADGVQLLFEGKQTVAIYSLNGILLHTSISTDSYECTLPQGMYIIRIGQDVHKFVR